MTRRSWSLLALLAVTLLGGGALWWAKAAETVPLAKLSHIHGIAIDPKDPMRLYLATHHGLYRTASDGAAAERVSDNRHDYMGFSPHPADPNRFYASGHPTEGGNLGVILSTDGGRSWRQIARGVQGPVDFHAMTISPADPEVIYGLYGGIQVSRDGGRSWASTGRPPADVFDLAASAKDADILYAATREGAMVSRDAGTSWQPLSVVKRPASLVHVTHEGTLYAFVLGQGLIKASEPALRWETVSRDFGDRVPLHLAVDPTNADRLLMVTDKSELLISTDAGRSWRPFAS